MALLGNPPVTDLPPQGSIAAAANWLSALASGSLATSLALFAIAGLGLAMLQGRLSLRDGMRIVIGCFILFAAPIIAKDLLGLAHWQAGPTFAAAEALPRPPIALPNLPPPNRDPYAGASVPMGN